MFDDFFNVNNSGKASNFLAILYLSVVNMRTISTNGSNQNGLALRYWLVICYGLSQNSWILRNFQSSLQGSNENKTCIQYSIQSLWIWCLLSDSSSSYPYQNVIRNFSQLIKRREEGLFPLILEGANESCLEKFKNIFQKKFRGNFPMRAFTRIFHEKLSTSSFWKLS